MIRAWAARLTAAALLIAAVVVVLVLVLGHSTTRRVAYVTDGATSSTIWVKPLAGGPARRLGPGSGPLLSPDGSLVAATAPAGDAAALLVYPAGGGSAHRLFDAARVSATPQGFSADGHYLAVALTSRDPASAAASGLAVIDTGSFATRIVAHGQIQGASFAPGSDRLAYAVARSTALTAPVNIRVVGAGGGPAHQLTHDGHSLNPVWGQAGIAFDRERLRPRGEPAYALWLMGGDGSGARRLARPAVPALRNGLQPVAFADRGRVLLADYVGPNTSQAWVVHLNGGLSHPAAAPLPGDSSGVSAGQGASVLVAAGGFLNPSDQQRVERVSLDGAAPQVLVRGGAEPSWNG